MGRKKKRNKWSAQPRKQQNPLAQQPQQLVAPKAVRDYWNNEMTAEERELIATSPPPSTTFTACRASSSLRWRTSSRNGDFT